MTPSSGEDQSQRSILVGIAGDSGAGKTTLTRGLVRILGEDRVTHVSADHYHRFDRAGRARHGLTPLNPECNHLDVLEQHVGHLCAAEPILKPVYSHRDGSFGPAEYLTPRQFTVVEGLLALHTPLLRDAYDIRLFLSPPDDLRRRWKVQRDCSRRGYTTDEVLEELDRRESDAETFIRPQRRHADLVISFMPGDRGDQEHLDAKVYMRPGIEHPALAEVVHEVADGISLVERGTDASLWIPGTISTARSEAIQEAIWSRMHFASHLRTERLGEFTAGIELMRSEALAITQLLVLYQMVTAAAAAAVGARSARTTVAKGAP